MEEKRELILKLGAKITDRIPVRMGLQKLTTESPEYWGLKEVVIDEMAELALAMDLCVGTTPEKLAKKTGNRIIPHFPPGACRLSAASPTFQSWIRVQNRRTKVPECLFLLQESVTTS